MMKSFLNQSRIMFLVIALALLFSGCTSQPKVEPQLVLTGHTNPVTDVTFSPDGRTLASVSVGDGTIRLWNSETGEMLSLLRSLRVNRAAFSPDGRILATSGIGALVTFWDVETEAQLETLDAHTNSPISGIYEPWLSGLEFSPDGRYLLTVEVGPSANFSNDYPVSLWETQTWQLLQRWEETPGQFAFSPDSTKLVIIIGDYFSYSGVLFSLDSLQEQGSLEGGWGHLTFSADSQRLVGWRNNGDPVLHFWNANTRKPITTLTLAEAETGDKEWFLTSVRFTANGQKLITGDCKNALNLWDGADGSHLSKLQLSPDVRWENCLVPIISPNGSLLATMDENLIKLWVLPEEFR